MHDIHTPGHMVISHQSTLNNQREIAEIHSIDILVTQTKVNSALVIDTCLSDRVRDRPESRDLMPTNAITPHRAQTSGHLPPDSIQPSTANRYGWQFII